MNGVHATLTGVSSTIHRFHRERNGPYTYTSKIYPPPPERAPFLPEQSVLTKSNCRMSTHIYSLSLADTESRSQENTRNNAKREKTGRVPPSFLLGWCFQKSASHRYTYSYDAYITIVVLESDFHLPSLLLVPQAEQRLVHSSPLCLPERDHWKTCRSIRVKGCVWWNRNVTLSEFKAMWIVLVGRFTTRSTRCKI